MEQMRYLHHETPLQHVVGTITHWKCFCKKLFRGTWMGEVQPSRCEDKERFYDVRDAGLKRKHVKPP